MKKPIKNFLILLSFVGLAACQSASPNSPLPITVGTLIEEYEKSSAGVRRKYDGKEITVRGYTASDAAMPDIGADQGSVMLREKDGKPTHLMTCWFSQEQVEQFSKIKGSQYITVKGVFTGEAGAELKFCKLIKIE